MRTGICFPVLITLSLRDVLYYNPQNTMAKTTIYKIVLRTGTVVAKCSINLVEPEPQSDEASAPASTALALYLMYTIRGFFKMS
jgi:hypothetical protein